MATATRQRRAFIRSAFAAGLLVPGGLSGLIRQALAQASAPQGVQRLRGEVLVNGKKAGAGSVVAPGDTVTTGPKSYATFVIGEDAFLVRGQTEVQLSGAERFVNLVRVITGGLLSVYAKGPPRKLQTSTATIGIRGTGAYLEAAPERTYFCLCYGEAELIPTAAPDQTELLRTVHHDQPRFVYAAGAERVVERAPVVNHRDAELILLESLVGREPPFVDTDEYRSGVRY
jgi:hypothetical protein